MTVVIQKILNSNSLLLTTYVAMQFQYNLTYTTTVRNWPTCWPKLCSVLHNLQLILSKSDWERELFVSLLWNSVTQRENKCLLFFQKKEASVMIAKKDSLAHLMMCKILVKAENILSCTWISVGTVQKTLCGYITVISRATQRRQNSFWSLLCFVSL